MCPAASLKSARLGIALVIESSPKAVAWIKTSTSGVQHSGVSKQYPRAVAALSVILMSLGGLSAYVIIEVEVIADLAVHRSSGNKVPPRRAGIAAAAGVERLLVNVCHGPTFGKGYYRRERCQFVRSLVGPFAKRV